MHKSKVPVGEIRGRGTIRDKDGKIKGTIEFFGQGTEEQYLKLKEALKETKDGSYSHNGGS